MRKTRLIAACLAALLTFPALFGAGRAEPAPIRLPIVMYHHISREPAAWGPYVVSEAELERDLKWLKDHGYETVSVQDLLDWEAGAFTMPEKMKIMMAPRIITLVSTLQKCCISS